MECNDYMRAVLPDPTRTMNYDPGKAMGSVSWGAFGKRARTFPNMPTFRDPNMPMRDK